MWYYFYMKDAEKASQNRYQKIKDYFNEWVADLPEFKIEPRSLRFWRDIFLVFIFAGLAGKVVDILWRILAGVPAESWLWQLWPIMAEPEAFGAVLSVILLYPLVYKKKVHPVLIYALAVILVSLVELVIGFVLIAVIGANPYWSYAHMPLNFAGQISLAQSLALGLAATVFLYIIFPIFYSFISRKPSKTVNKVALFFALWYGLSLLCQLIIGFRLLI